MNIKIITLAMLGIVTCIVDAGAATITPTIPGGGIITPIDPEPITPVYSCSVNSSCNSNGEVNSQQNVTGGTNCASTGTVYLNVYCSNCGYDSKSANTCFKISTCNSCPSGYTRTAKSLTRTECPNFVGAQYYTCCGACNNCNNSEWTNVSGKLGKQQRTIRTCDCGTCKDTGTEYRCSAGYYGLANASSTCTLCPLGGTSDAGAKTKYECYATKGSDTTGSYEFTEPCYYDGLTTL